jgi:hypothetical protein
MFAAPPASAQHGGSPPALHTAPPEASQFNFLLGEWELDVKPAPNGLAQRIHGVPKLVGMWKAWRALDGWGVEDELRITDRSGNPMAFSHAVRFFDANAKSWRTSNLDVYRATWTASTAQWRGGEMVTTGSGTDSEGKRYLSRARYSAITPDSFTFTQERSTDNGKSWSLNLTIQAKKVAAPSSR